VSEPSSSDKELSGGRRPPGPPVRPPWGTAAFHPGGPRRRIAAEMGASPALSPGTRNSGEMPGLRPPLRQASARLPLVASSRRRAEASCGSGKFPRTPPTRSGAGYGAAGTRRPQDSGLPRRALPPPSLRRPSASLRASPEPSRQTSFSPAGRAVLRPSALHRPPVSAVSRLRAALAPRGDLLRIRRSFPGCRAGPSFAHRGLFFPQTLRAALLCPRCVARARATPAPLRGKNTHTPRSRALRSRAPYAMAWGGFPKPLAPAPGAMFTRTQSAHPRRPPPNPPCEPPGYRWLSRGGLEIRLF